MFAWHRQDLDRLATESRARRLALRQGADFSSNDYLGFAGLGLLRDAVSAALECRVPVGSGGSRLLRGNHPEHEALEAEAAACFGSDSALFFSSGFAANSAFFSTLPQPDDVIFYDELIHASVHEGLRLSRARSQAVQHNDANAFAEAIRDWRTGGGRGTPWIAVEALYSMDGDITPLAELVEIADRHEGVLVVDEAHSTGVFGESGKGLSAAFSARENLVTLRTFGKAMGCEGAVICGPQIVRDFLINRARNFIFSTAPSPLMAAIASASLRLMQDAESRREELWTLVSMAQKALAGAGFPASGSQIIPVILGGDARTMAIASSLQDAGFDVRGIRPPTVPNGTSRLRIAITLNVSENDIRALAAKLAALA